MLGPFANAIAKAAASTPMLTQHEAPIPGRVLLVDGDALCYTCAGSDDTEPGQARINLMERIRRAQQGSRSESVRVLVTARGSHKGHRYAVAVVKPYQGQRDGGRRPKNWEYLRTLVEGGLNEYPTELTAIAEADDLFSKYSFELGPENVVLHYQDKDMRQVPGWHLTWDDFGLVYVPAGTWELRFNDKVYGRKWFWMQMLHGDGADNIPGLPEYADGSVYSKSYKVKEMRGQIKYMQCGESGADKILAGCTNEQEGRDAVRNAYLTCYPDAAERDLQVLEQGILLWMRQRPGDVFDVCAEGNPLHGYDQARGTILQRIAEVQACQPS